MPSIVLFFITLAFVHSCAEEKKTVEFLQINNDGEKNADDLIDPVNETRRAGDREVKIANKNLLLKDFEKPLQSYPMINSSGASYGGDGLLYRNGLEDPFSGRLIDFNSKGIALLEVSFLDGQPHGQQVRRNDDGIVLMEAFFDRGSLTGIKTKWWSNGIIKEEEYWDNGVYKGRCYWDESGRLLKEERTN